MNIVSTPSAPKAIGPYSQGAIANGFVFLSGQIPLHPETGELIASDIQTETERVLDNISAVLEAAGSGFHRIVKTTIFLTNLSDFQAVNEVYAKRFTSAPPARSTIQVAALPRGARVEIEVIAQVVTS